MNKNLTRGFIVAISCLIQLFFAQLLATGTIHRPTTEDILLITIIMFYVDDYFIRRGWFV